MQNNPNSIKLPHVMTIKDTLKYFRENCPETHLTEYMLRNWIRSKKLAVIKAGSKYLINLDNLISILTPTQSDSPINDTHGIRPVPEDI